MTTTAFDEQLAEISARIDRLHTRARAGAPEATPQIERHLEPIRIREASARAAVREEARTIEEQLGQLTMRLDVAEQSVAADLSEEEGFAAAVEAELRSWDAYLERLQTEAAAKAEPAREQAESAIRELRTLRITIAERLARVAEASNEERRELEQQVAVARDELERQADELSAMLR